MFSFNQIFTSLTNLKYDYHLQYRQDHACALIGEKPMFYQTKKAQKENILLFFATVPPYHKAHEEAAAVYYTVIKHFRHLRTLAKRRKH